MGRRSLALIVLFALSLTLFAPSAWAACITKNLSGTWYAYLNMTDSDGQTNFWVRGVIKLKSTGSVKLGTTFITDKGDKVKITGGKLSISSACVVIGRLNLKSVSSGQKFVCNINHAAMDRGKTVVSGVLKNPTFDEIGSFTLIKK